GNGGVGAYAPARRARRGACGLGGARAGDAREGTHGARAARGNCAPLVSRNPAVGPLARVAAAARSGAVPRDRRALVCGRQPQEPRVRVVLLRPRTRPAIPDDRAPPRRPDLVLRARAVTRLLPLVALAPRRVPRRFKVQGSRFKVGNSRYPNLEPLTFQPCTAPT